MATTYNYIFQDILATTLIEPLASDSFYYPLENQHTGYACDGNLYLNGVQIVSPTALPSPYTSYQASWLLEFLTAPNPFRGSSAQFPSEGLVLLSPTAMTVLDGTVNPPALWMQFLLADGGGSGLSYALTDNYNNALQGFTPSGLDYSDGIISVVYTPDAGNQDGGGPMGTTSNLVLTVDFSQELIFLDVAMLNS
jgi:hypothetical protein